MDLTFSDLASWIGIASIVLFLVGFLPGFYLSYIIFKKLTQSTIATSLISIMVGYIVGTFFLEHTADILRYLPFIREPIPTIVIASILVLEVIIIIIHIRTHQKRGKNQKRSRK